MKKNNFYNPTDVRKRKYVSSMRNRILAGVIAAITAMTPTVSYAADFEYATIDTTSTTNEDSQQHVDDSVEINTSTDNVTTELSSDTLKLAEEAEKTGEETETKFLFINLANAENGKIILNEGEESEQQIKLESQNVTDESGESKAEMRINAYDKDGILISTENAEDNNYIYVYETKTEYLVSVTASPNSGFKVSEYSLTDKIVNGTEEDVGFEETASDFSQMLFMQDNMSLKVSFSKNEMEDDLTISNNKLQSIQADADTSDNDDISVNDDTNNTAVDTESDLTIDSNNDSDSLHINEDIPNETHFIDEVEGTEQLDATEFASSRLIMTNDTDDIIIDTEHLIGNYDNIYLLQYKTPQQAMNAYVYYLKKAAAVEPDVNIVAAAQDDTTDDEYEYTSGIMTADNNALTALNEAEISDEVTNTDKTIALIDTGVSENPNVIDRVSLIDDSLSGGTHGDDMANYIIKENQNAKIVSIRALNNDGTGSVSSIVSAIEYAINANVDIINLSMYTKKNLGTAILENEIQKAINSKITVVGSAGNNGRDAVNYVPGSIDDAFIIGAVNANDIKIDTSNYGDTVDYYVVSNSTSQAAATFTGFISKNGTDVLKKSTNGQIFDVAYMNTEELEKTQREIEELLDSDVHAAAEKTPAKLNITSKSSGNSMVLHFYSGANTSVKIYCGENNKNFSNGVHTRSNLVGSKLEGKKITKAMVLKAALAQIYQYKYQSSTSNARAVTQMYTWFIFGNANSVTKSVIKNTGQGTSKWNKMIKWINSNISKYKLSYAYKYSLGNAQAMVCFKAVPLPTPTPTPTNTPTPTPRPATLKIGKRIVNWKLASASSRIGKVDATFTVYSDAACTKAVKTCRVTGNDSNAWGSVSLNAGTYYVKETTQISGTVDNRNTKYGPLTLKAGESKSLADLIPSSQYNALNINTSSKEVMNYPMMFRGKLLTKIDKNTKAPIAGAVFKVLYSEWGNPKWNTARTWYFVTDENGEIKYDRGHLADNNPKFKDKYKSSDMFVYDWNDDTKTALPPCNLRIQEVEAPDGYVLDETWYSEWTQIKSNTDVNLKMDKNLVIEEEVAKNEWRLQANAKKVDANGNGLANAVFGIWDNPGCKNRVLGYLETDENGISNTYQMRDINKNTDSVTLYCKEISAPDGYVKSDTIYPLIYTQDKYNELYKEDRHTQGELQTFGGKEGIINDLAGWYVSGFAKKITKTGDTLAGATFGIYDNEECDEYSLLTTVTSGEDGVTNIGTIGVSENKDEITLYLKEIDAPEGYAATDEVFSQTWHKENYKTADIATGEVKQFGPEDGIVNDDGWRVNVFAKKVNPQGRALAGAEFGVYADKELANKIGTLTSGKDGVTNTLTVTCKTSENTVTLWCQEEKAPTGCVPVNAVYDVTFDKSDYDAIVADTGNLSGETKQFGPEKGIVNDDPWEIRFKAKKVDTEGTALEGATFAVYDDKECTNQIATLSSGEDGFTNEGTFTVNADETSKTLYCKETSAPDGYVLNTEVFEQTWNKDDYRDKKDEDENFIGESKQFGGDAGIVNKVKGIDWRFRCQAKKIAIDGTPLASAKFGVYTDQECADNTQIGILESGDNGLTNILDVHVDADTEIKTIYCKEIQAPDGYDISNQVFSLTFTSAGYLQELNAGNSDGQLKLFGPEDGNGIVNRPTKPVNVKIHKTSNAPDEIFNLSGYNLSGATFEITGDNGFYGTLTTDSDGNTGSLDLPNEDAVYTIEESIAPNGHITAESQEFEVKMPDDASKDIEIEFIDEPLFGGEFKIEKNSTKGNPIKDVVFKAEFFDGDDINTTPKKIWYLASDENGVVAMDDSHISTDSTFVSDSFYKCNDKVVIPVGGTLRVTEIKAPAGYILDSTPKIISTSDESEMYSELGEITNDLVPCKIQLKKYDEDGKTTLSGIKFRLEFLEESESSQKVGEITPAPTLTPDIDEPDTDESDSSGDNETKNPDIDNSETSPGGSGAGVDEEDKIYPYVRLLKVGESIEAETDENGEITWENLDQGRYRITEIETTTGHTLLKDPIYITLPITMTDKDAKAMSAATDQGKFDSGYSNKWYFYEATFEVTNNAKFIMPMTGDNGFWKFGFIGFGTIAVLGTGLIIFDKKSKKQKRRQRVTKK